MRNLAPEGAVYQAGTLSGNPVAMAAGVATLGILERQNAWARLEELGRHLEGALAPILAAAPFPAQLVRQGSLFWMNLQAGEPPRRADQIDAGAAGLYKTIFHGLLARGVALAPSAYEVGFLSLAHRPEDLDRLAGALAQVVDGHPGTPAGR